MPTMEVAFLTQDAVLWPAVGVDAYGQPSVGQATQIPVRWNTKRTERLDSKGTTVVLDAVAVVNRDVLVGSQMWLGSLAAWNASGKTQADQEVHLVKFFDSTTDLKGRSAYRSVSLMRLHNVQGQ